MGIFSFFLFYFVFIFYTGYDILEYSIYGNNNEGYGGSMMLDILDTSDVDIVTPFIRFYIIFYILLYFIYFVGYDRKLEMKRKVQIFLRDFVCIFGFFFFFFSCHNILGIHNNYYKWYKNPDNFGGEEFVCMNNSIRLLLERNYPHEVIVNPYKNFYEFYNKYDTPQSDGKVVTNKLQMQLGNKNFLSTCKNKKGENYYKKYKELYISEPYVEPVYEPGDYQYFISNENLQNILNQLKQRESYSDHLITYNYKEFPSEITVDEYDNIGSGKKQIDKMIEDKKKELYPDEIDWNKYEYIKKITKIYDFLKGKGDITYSGKKYGISEDFYDKVIKESKGWVDFFYDEKFHYTTTKTSLYKDEKKIFSHENLYLGVDGAINRLGYIGGKLSFEYTYFEDDSKENINSDIWWGGESLNQKYQLNGSKNLFEYNGKIGFITSNQDGMFLMYDGKQITEFFSGIRTISCCMISKFPFDIYDNGVLQFVFRRDNELYVGSLELF